MIKTVNNHFKNEWLTLYKGKGYFYFIFDNGTDYECHSVYVNNFRDYTIERWIDIGQTFLNSINRSL